MSLSKLLLAFVSVSAVLACPDHDFNLHPRSINKRADGTQDWAYDASYDWGRINASMSNSYALHSGHHINLTT